MEWNFCKLEERQQEFASHGLMLDTRDRWEQRRESSAPFRDVRTELWNLFYSDSPGILMMAITATDIPGGTYDGVPAYGTRELLRDISCDALHYFVHCAASVDMGLVFHTQVSSKRTEKARKESQREEPPATVLRERYLTPANIDKVVPLGKSKRERR